MPEIFGDVTVRATVETPAAPGEVIVMTTEIIVVVGPTEEFGVNAEFQIKSALSRVGLRFIATDLTADGLTPIPLNFDRGVNAILPPGVVRVGDPGQEVVFYDGPEEIDGKPGFTTLIVQFATTDGLPFTDPATGQGRLVTVNPGWSTTLTAELGERTGRIRVGLTETL